MSEVGICLFHVTLLLAALAVTRAEWARRHAWTLSLTASACAAAWLSWVSEPPRPFEDFLTAYYVAGRAVLSAPDGFVELLRNGVHGFVNLPIVAYLFAPAALLPPRYAALAFLVAGICAALAAWAMLVRAMRLDARGAALLLFLFAMNGPLYNSLKEGNTSHIVLALLAGALLCLRRGREIAAGILLGSAAIIKLPLLLFGLYFALRRRWRVVAAGAAVCLGAVGASVLVFGWDTHVLWYRLCVAPFSGNPIPAFNVQSIHALVARFETGYEGLHDWDPHTLSAAGELWAMSLVLLVYAVAVLVVMVSAARNSARSGEETGALEVEFLVVAALACITSPLSWSHYYVWFLMAAAYFCRPAVHSFGRASAVLALSALALLSLPVLDIRFDQWIADELYARLPVSYHLIGGMLALGLLLWMRMTGVPLVDRNVPEGQDRRRQTLPEASAAG